MHIHWDKESLGGREGSSGLAMKGNEATEKGDVLPRGYLVHLLPKAYGEGADTRSLSRKRKENSLRDRLAFEILAYFSFENPINFLIP